MPIIIPIGYLLKQLEKLKEMQELQASGHYETPNYLKEVPIGSPEGNRLSVPQNHSQALEKTAPIDKLGSIGPTLLPYKKELASPQPVPALTTCTLCNGPVKDGECVMCSGKQCRVCGEINFATTINCSRCGQSL
jgi:hypothetical protein